MGAAGVGASAAPQWFDSSALILAVPPLRLAGEAVRLALESAASSILFVPHWPEQHWWRRLLRSEREWSIFGRWPAAAARAAKGSELEGNDQWQIIGIHVPARSD